eukprot:6095538-Pyramimonas_sp.AAC.1
MAMRSSRDNVGAAERTATGRAVCSNWRGCMYVFMLNGARSRGELMGVRETTQGPSWTIDYRTPLPIES